MAHKAPVYLAVLVVLGMALLTAGIVLANDTPLPAQTVAQDGPAADGQALLTYILEENPYTEWGTWNADRWSDFGGLLESSEPHGNTVRIYVNEVALEAAAADDFDGTLPYGSIIVKENWTGTVEEPGDLDALTVMYKVEGFNPDAGDWFWLKSAGDGSAIDAEGAVEGCISCHGQDGNADYLLRYAFGEEPATYYGEPLPEATGQAVLDYVLQTSDYTQWESWPDTETDDFPGPLPSGEPHGQTVRIFVNDRALDALHRDNFDGTLPYGSIVVKENWTGTVEEPGDLDALTIMYKVEGFNPDAGDWFWLKSAGDGSAIDAEGAVEGCINCHGQDADYLLRFDPADHAKTDGAMMGEEGDAMESGIDADAVIDRACTVCHTRDRIDNASKDAAGWAATIDRMIGNGARISDAERQALIDYLASR